MVLEVTVSRAGLSPIPTIYEATVVQFPVFEKILGHAIDLVLITWDKGKASYYFESKETEKLGRLFMKKVKENPAFIKKVRHEVLASSKSLQKTADKIFQTNLSLKSSQELSQLFKEYMQAYQDVLVYGLLSFHCTHVMEKELSVWRFKLGNNTFAGERQQVIFVQTKDSVLYPH